MSEKNIKTILILDDEPHILEFIDNIVSEDPELNIHNTLFSEHSNDAIDIVSRSKVDICVTDTVMPDRDGVFFVKELSRISKSTKIVVMSAHKNEDDVRSILDFSKFNIRAFIQKPFPRSYFKITLLDLIQEP